MRVKEFTSVSDKEFRPRWFDKSKVEGDYKVLEVESHVGTQDCVESAMHLASGEEWFDNKKIIFFEHSRGEVSSRIAKYFGGSRMCSFVGRKNLAINRLYEESKEVGSEYFAYGMFELSLQEVLNLHSRLFSNPNALLFFVDDSFKFPAELSEALLPVFTGKRRQVYTQIPELLNISCRFPVSGIGVGNGWDEYEGFFFHLYKLTK